MTAPDRSTPPDKGAVRDQEDRLLPSGDGSKGRKPGMPPWQTLQCEDGHTITVPDDWTDKVGGLIRLLEDNYGGAWSADNPVLLAALTDCRIAVWHSFTKRDIEGEGVDWEPGDGTFYGDCGSGAKYITVFWYCGSLWDLGDRAEEVEPKAKAVSP